MGIDLVQVLPDEERVMVTEPSLQRFGQFRDLPP